MLFLFQAHEFKAVNDRIDALSAEVKHVHEEVDLIKAEMHPKDDHQAAVETHHVEDAHHVEDHHHGKFVHASTMVTLRQFGSHHFFRC